jgi:N12 class adenine-specific DNA methylase
MEQSDVIGECVGKVGTLPGTIMEMRALKLCIKPMLVVPNVDLASKEFEGAYPMARNLVVANSDVEKTVRKQCLTEIDSFSGDVVICGRKACEYLLGTGRRFPEMGIDAIVVAYHDSWPSYTSVMKMWNCLESNSRLHPQDPEVLPVLRF